jgi:hypothetical protein
MLTMVALVVCPPWKAHGEFAGHYRIDQVAWMEPDHTRLFVELFIVVLVTGLVIVKLWGTKRKGQNKR